MHADSSVGAHQMVQMHLSVPPRKSVHWQPEVRGEKEGGYPKQMVSTTPLRPLDTG